MVVIVGDLEETGETETGETETGETETGEQRQKYILLGDSLHEFRVWIGFIRGFWRVWI